MFDQWEAQMLAMILVRARTGLYSEISDDEIAAPSEPIKDVSARLAAELKKIGKTRRWRCCRRPDDDSLPEALVLDPQQRIFAT